MIEAWPVADVYAAEDALMATLPEGALMARAVDRLVEVTARRLESRGGTTVAALVGPGNNGGDALYAAARLAEAGFGAAAVHLDTVHAGALGDAQAAGVLLSRGDDPEGLARVAEADVVLDGILGIGGRAGLPDFARAWVDAVPDTAYVIAVDLPSGQDPVGEVLTPEGIFADETVTFSVAKPVHLLPPTSRAVGRLTVVDIGLRMTTPPVAARLTTWSAGDLWPVPLPTDDKYSRGVLGVVAGGERYPGAAVLSCTAAVEAGAGMVRYVGPARPESMVLAAAPEVVPGPGQVQAWVIGPGLDLETADPTQVEAARGALESDLPVLLDAGGLDLVTGRRVAPTLLTPHAGECARLLSRLAGRETTRAEVEAAPLRHAEDLVAQTGAAVLLKGHTTLIVPAEAGQVTFSQADAPAWLATAGAGDVLAGLTGMLLAAGLDPAPAGALGAHVHGQAARRASGGGPVRALGVARALRRTITGLVGRTFG